MTLVLGSLQLGLLYGLLAMGIYIAFRILNIPDLTAEGSFTFGLAVSAAFTVAGHPLLGIVMSILAGALAGVITGLLQTKCGIHPILAGILTMSGLYSVNLAIMGSSSNLSLISNDNLFKMSYEALGLDKDVCRLIVSAVVVILVAAVLIFFFKTHIGLCIRATGDNEEMVKASSINIDITKVLALAIANASIGLSGGLIAQYQGFADINSGVGILVVGLASVIIGELFTRKKSVTVGFLSAIIGSVVYRFIVALAMSTSFFPAYALKLVSAVIVGIALALPAMKEFHGGIKNRKVQKAEYLQARKQRKKGGE